MNNKLPLADSAVSKWQALLRSQGFGLVPGGAMEALLLEQGSLGDWPGFAASWDHLPLDHWMADQGRYRRRRHAVFAAGPDQPIARLPHQPHYQSLEYNALNGGIERWFEPIEPQIAASASLQTILGLALALFAPLSPTVRKWKIEVHQFRIEATPTQAGQPTPEGVHRDGVDWVLVLMIQRRNIAAGTTTIHALDGSQLGSFTLALPFDAALVDDHRCCHGVTAVHPIDPGLPAQRDVLVVTFKAG